MGPIGCHATSVRNRRFSLRNNPERAHFSSTSRQKPAFTHCVSLLQLFGEFCKCKKVVSCSISALIHVWLPKTNKSILALQFMCRPYTEQSDTVSWLKTVVHQLRCFLHACYIRCSFWINGYQTSDAGAYWLACWQQNVLRLVARLLTLGRWSVARLLRSEHFTSCGLLPASRTVQVLWLAFFAAERFTSPGSRTAACPETVGKLQNFMRWMFYHLYTDIYCSM
jgi:hypothetical protein